MRANSIPASGHLTAERLPAAAVSAAWLVATLAAMGVWAQLDRLGPGIVVALAVTLLALWRHGDLLFPGESFDPHLPVLPARRTAMLLVGLLCCAPVVVSLCLTWDQNFPFVGDHDYQLFASRHALEFWRVRGWVLFGILLGLAKVPRLRRSGAWPLLALGGLLAWSFWVEPSPYFARYPGAFYLLAAPLNAVAQFMRWASPLDANRLTNALGLPVWLFLLRPLVVKRWPDVGALAFCLFFFWQKDVVYYFTSTYLEPWCIVFVLLAAEILLTRPAEQGWLACLLTGTAAAFKEQGILVLPFAWLAATISLPRGAGRLRRVVPAIVSALPFCA